MARNPLLKFKTEILNSVIYPKLTKILHDHGNINIEELHMYIFNRWGELIHEIYTIDGYWDGTYKNIPCQQDVYVWFLKYRFVGNNFFEEIRGHVTLVR